MVAGRRVEGGIDSTSVLSIDGHLLQRSGLRQHRSVFEANQTAVEDFFLLALRQVLSAGKSVRDGVCGLCGLGVMVWEMRIVGNDLN